MLFRQFKTIVQAFRDVFADSGFSMAGAVAYSFVLSLFPFCIFLGALAGYFGGETLAKQAVEQLFQMVPKPVAEAIAPEVMAVMGQSRFGLLTFGVFIALFFATSAIESLRAALNLAYRVKERRSYLWCLDAELAVRGGERDRHAGAGLGRGGRAGGGVAHQAVLAAVACRYRLDGAAGTLRDRGRPPSARSCWPITCG